MTICQHVLIINEECVNCKNKCHILIIHLQISRLTYLYVFLTYMKITICQHVLIINEECVNFKNKCHILIIHPQISRLTYFYVFLALYENDNMSTCINN